MRLQRIVPVVWAFSRPHTMLGTAAAIPALGAYAGGATLDALPAALCANLYVTGLNQITDCAVDVVNKPDLPLASGQLSRIEAKTVVAFAGVLSVALSMHSSLLLATVLSSMALGTLYSAEPFRWKRSSALAALSIVATRGLIVNVGFYSHAQRSFGIPLGPVLFFSAFASVIAILKDVPDTDGDRMHDLPSFALSHGRRTILLASAGVMVTALSTAACMLHSWISPLALAMSTILVARTVAVARDSTRQNTTDLYQMYWKCFYVCYMALPLAK